jgi:hypothetical protein
MHTSSHQNHGSNLVPVRVWHLSNRISLMEHVLCKVVSSEGIDIEGNTVYRARLMKHVYHAWQMQKSPEFVNLYEVMYL